MNTVLSNESFAQLFEKEEQRLAMPVIEAIVLKVSHHGVLVDANLKSPFLIPLEEFEGEDLPAVNAFISVFVQSHDNQATGSCLSRLTARRLIGTHRLQEAKKNGLPIEATITGQNKGGWKIISHGVQGFMPKSLAKVSPDDQLPLGMQIEAFIEEVTNDGSKLIVRRHIDSGVRQDDSSKIKEGDVVEATVRSLMSYGAFVSFGTLSGLLHISQIDHKRIERIEDELSVGQVMQLQIIQIDKVKNRIALSRKSLLPQSEDAVQE